MFDIIEFVRDGHVLWAVDTSPENFPWAEAHNIIVVRRDEPSVLATRWATSPWRVPVYVPRTIANYSYDALDEERDYWMDWEINEADYREWWERTSFNSVQYNDGVVLPNFEEARQIISFPDEASRR